MRSPEERQEVRSNERARIELHVEAALRRTEVSGVPRWY
jgi:hypothetical protein